MSSLRDLGLVEGGGVVDIDALNVGMKRSKRELRRILLDLLSDLQKRKEYEEGVPLSVLIREFAKQLRISEEEAQEKLDELISLLKRSGDIMEPRPGKYTRV
jgi:DNA replicative helicase MCM subunit Mcm2 (Cdc46/Mcm family)